jgi:predicted TIM-barrel fold metal-dependent hydrolase
MRFLSDEDLKKTRPADEGDFVSPIPTRVVSNGEFNPPPQTEDQKKFEARIRELADELAPKHGMDRRRFLASSAGMAAAFIAMNDVFGPMYNVGQAEAAEPGAADERASALRDQFIIDCQTHFVRDDYPASLSWMREFASKHWNPKLKEKDEYSIEEFQFQNYMKEIFMDSDTDIALLSGSPTDDEHYQFLTNDQIAAAKASLNKEAGSTRMLSHGIITPKSEGWMDDVEHCIEELNVDSWKGYTIGDPIFQTKRASNWRLDDEENVYPFYERIVKAGINTVCIHKGLMPVDYKESWPELWPYSTVWDLGKAAKDWPEINFVIYHSAMRPFIELPDASLREFEETGRMEWVTDLAEIPEKFGVSNVYGELGTVFGNTSVTHPRLAAAMLGTLIKGLGEDKVIWGTDSVWYGSPQWQIEAMRRLEMPEDLQEKYGFTALGDANSPLKNKIFSGNAARLYNLDISEKMAELSMDKIAAAKQQYVALNEGRSNLRYGYIA